MSLYNPAINKHSVNVRSVGVQNQCSHWIVDWRHACRCCLCQHQIGSFAYCDAANDILQPHALGTAHGCKAQDALALVGYGCWDSLCCDVDQASL